MRKLFLSLLAGAFALFVVSAVKADEFQEFIKQNKPCAILITADWAENASEVQSSFNNAAGSFDSKYNFKTLNIASPETKEFNQSNYIYTNLPYVVLYKSNGRMSRWINRDCVLDSSCMSEKLDLFAN